jgi:hypothetical protein
VLRWSLCRHGMTRASVAGGHGPDIQRVAGNALEKDSRADDERSSFSAIRICKSVTVAGRSEAYTVFASSEAEIVGSNPT